MSIVVNGATIPTNVANTLMVAGVSVTKVLVGATVVWEQQLLPVFTAGTAFNPYGAYTASSAYAAWQTIATRRFTGGNGSVFSIRAMAYSTYYGEWVTYGAGRVLKNGVEVISIGNASGTEWAYSGFVNVTLNTNDVLTFQSYSGYGYTGYEGGGGQVFCAQDGAAPYFVA